jgi:post-segregation antitoxin (ccd killing protein)
MGEQQNKQPQRMSLLLDPDVLLQAKAQARQEHTNLSKLIETALAAYIREQKK